MNYVRHLHEFYVLLKKDQVLSSAHVSLYMALFQCWNFNRFFNPFPLDRENVLQLSKIGSRATYQKCLKDLHKAGYIFCHSRASQFDRVKITMVRLDDRKDQAGSIQLDIFSASDDSPRPKNEPAEKNHRPKNDPVPGPILTVLRPENEPVTGPHLGHLYKLNNKTVNSVCYTRTNFYSKNLFLKKAENEQVQAAGPRPTKVEESMPAAPTSAEVETFFREKSYPATEAQKFFLYNQGKAWMFSPGLRIHDWQSLAHKWMLNASQHESLKHSGASATHHINQQKNYGEPL